MRRRKTPEQEMDELLAPPRPHVLLMLALAGIQRVIRLFATTARMSSSATRRIIKSKKIPPEVEYQLLAKINVLDLNMDICNEIMQRVEHLTAPDCMRILTSAEVHLSSVLDYMGYVIKAMPKEPTDCTGATPSGGSSPSEADPQSTKSDSVHKE